MFIAATGQNYRRFLDDLHQELRFDLYLEIGARSGQCLTNSRSASVVVDPRLQLRLDKLGEKPSLHLFRMSSNAFFVADHLRNLGLKPTLSFIDGIHSFECLLSDFMNIEAAGLKTSVIVMNDCCPSDDAMAARSPARDSQEAWVGDLWKIIPILQEYRPDLKVEVLDCAPAGLVVVSNLNPESQALKEHYDEIVERYGPTTIADFGVERFFASFKYIDSALVASGDFQMFSSAACVRTPSREPVVSVHASSPAKAARIRKLSVYNVDIYSGHRVLRDFGADLARCLSRPLSKPLDVYVGVHAVNQPLETGRFRVGIQTEQYLDANGQPMWRFGSEHHRLRHVSNYDVLLDLSLQNRPTYDFLPDHLQRKLFFGPCIFPDYPIDPDFTSAPPLFFGALNERRRVLLGEIETRRPISVAPHGTFGRSLDALIARHGAVLNVHFRQGEYSEYPRFLKAYLRGKPIISEALAPPLRSNEHYFDLFSEPTETAIREMFNRLSGWVEQYSFAAFLESALTSALLHKSSEGIHLVNPAL